MIDTIYLYQEAEKFEPPANIGITWTSSKGHVSWTATGEELSGLSVKYTNGTNRLSLTGSIRKIVTGNNNNNEVIKLDDANRVLSIYEDLLKVSNKWIVGRLDCGEVKKCDVATEIARWHTALLINRFSVHIERTGMTLRNKNRVIRVYDKVAEMQGKKTICGDYLRTEVQVNKQRNLMRYKISSVESAFDTERQRDLFSKNIDKIYRTIVPSSHDFISQEILKEHSLLQMVEFWGFTKLTAENTYEEIFKMAKAEITDETKRRSGLQMYRKKLKYWSKYLDQLGIKVDMPSQGEKV